MTSLSDFNNLGRIGADKSDNTQRNISNGKFIDYSLSNYFSDNDSHVNFATKNKNIHFKNSLGGLSGKVIDYDSMLTIKKENKDAQEKLELHQRPFVTVPYLGRGPSNPDLESKLLQGEVITEKKSTSTIMDKTFIDYSEYPLLDDKKSEISNPKNLIQELALHGWTRGGIPTREVFYNNEENKK